MTCLNLRIISSIKRNLKLFSNVNRSSAQVSYFDQLDKLLILQGQALAVANAERAPLKSLHQAEFKVYSQFGEDGIIQYLIQEAIILDCEKIFVEFGVQDYTESNTRFLLQSNYWKGLIIDASTKYMNSVRESDLYWRHDLTALSAWIDRDNINNLLSKNGFEGDIGILSIDIDGNDYWIWEAINAINPVIVIVEWNSVFGPNHLITVPYSKFFDRHKAHFSCLYWGASIAAFEALGKRKGYSLIGSNSAGNNLFFVRHDRLGRLIPSSASQSYVTPSFRDSRDIAGELNFLTGAHSYRMVENLPVIDILANELTTLAALDSSIL